MMTRQPSRPRARRVGGVALTLLLAGATLAPAVARPATADSATEAAARSAPVDLNRATVEELVEVPGIGPVTARRILEFRKEHGPFSRVEDLLKVKGIGEKSFEKLRGHVTVSKATKTRDS